MVAESVLLVEDDRDLREFLSEVLGQAGYAATAFATADLALKALDEGAEADLVVTDLILPGKRGHELLEELRRGRPELNVIVITAFGSIDSAIEMIKKGAYDYLAKPVQPDMLLLAVERALEDSRLRRELARLRKMDAVTPPGFIGASRPMQALFDLIRRAAGARHPVLVTGESGTGKELVARALHTLSGRRPFVPVNCSALPEHLLESELFGHEKGAFTGADRDRPGLFEAAHRGTLFLDEIADLPQPLQPKLLRALEEGEVRRVGATDTRRIDVRLVAATNRDLEAAVKEGRFREDVFWRLNVLHIAVPPLRERAADVPLLAERFLDAATSDRRPRTPARIAPDTMALLTAYAWPGTVRELRNAIERAVTLSTTDELRPDDLPERILAGARAAALVSRSVAQEVPLRDVERAYTLEILRRVGGNKSRAAEILGMDRKTLYRKLEEYGESA